MLECLKLGIVAYEYVVFKLLGGCWVQLILNSLLGYALAKCLMILRVMGV